MSLVTADTSSVSLARLQDVADTARAYMNASKAPATMRAYRTDWRLFSEWCDSHDVDPLPCAPEVLALYLADQAGVLAVATLQRRLTSINEYHRQAGHESPTRAEVVRRTWTGIRRTFGTAQHGKAPARTRDVRAMVDTLDPDTLAGARDRAMLVIGFAGALRRSEIVALDVGDVDETDDGLVVFLRRSKTDQEGQGARLGLPYGSETSTCPVRAWRAWRDASGVEDGAVFRPVDRHGNMADRRLGGRAVAEVVKRCAAAAGLDPVKFAGHSLRAGLITSAAEAGVSDRDIMRHSRHKSADMMRRYIRDAQIFDRNAAAAVGL